mgnify:FL=1
MLQLNSPPRSVTCLVQVGMWPQLLHMDQQESFVDEIEILSPMNYHPEINYNCSNTKYKIHSIIKQYNLLHQHWCNWSTKILTYIYEETFWIYKLSKILVLRVACLHCNDIHNDQTFQFHPPLCAMYSPFYWWSSAIVVPPELRTDCSIYISHILNFE